MTLPGPDPHRLTEELMAMIAIPSINPFGADPAPGRREREMGDYLLARMAELGMETGNWEIEPGRPNVWGRLKGAGSGPTIMLAGHLDTVGIEGYEDGLDPRVDDGRIYGRGACDMKAALACYLETIRLIREAGVTLPGDVIVAGTCDEEGHLGGSRDWQRLGPTADLAIIGEPTSLRVCPAHRGQLCLFFRTQGASVHSSRPELGVNAVEHMARVIGHFGALDQELCESGLTHPLCGTGRFSMNVIRGGTISSSIPDFCELEVDRRLTPGESASEILAGFRARLDELEASTPNLRVTLSKPTIDLQPLDVPVDHPLVLAIKRAVGKVTGAQASVAAFPAGTDAPHMGCPCVILGPGNLEQAHTNNEFVELRQMEMASDIYRRTIFDLNELDVHFGTVTGNNADPTTHITLE